jgi:hypothetical protein
MKIFNYDDVGRFTFESHADPDPLQPGNWLLPARSTPKPPPATVGTDFAVFKEEIDDWVVQQTPAPDPSKARASRWESIKVERDRRKAGGFKVGALWFHSDADSRIQHIGLKDKARDLITAGGAMTDNLIILGQSVKWKTMDGSFATITAQLAFDIVAAAGDLDARLFTVAETHRVAMEAAADPATYDFSAGWPETFGG